MIGTCIGIFFARMIDVTFGTIKTVNTVKGKTYIAAMLAFIEVFIWFMVAREALNTELTSLWVPFSYSAGYATGTLLGTFISNKFINGLLCVQIITKKGNDKLIGEIRDKGYGLSIVSLENDYDSNKREMYIVETNKRNLKQLMQLVKEDDENSFIFANDTKFVLNGHIK